jgi:antitoxin CcdA
MRHEPVASRKRKPLNLSLDVDVVAGARETGINMSRVAEDALRAAVKAEREKRWLEDNREAIESSNRWFAQHGLPFADLRVR